MQRINNNIVTSEYLKSDGRISKVSKTIRLCYQQLTAGLLVLFKKLKSCLYVGLFLFLTACFGPTLTQLGPLKITASDVITTPGKLIITQKEKTNGNK